MLITTLPGLVFEFQSTRNFFFPTWTSAVCREKLDQQCSFLYILPQTGMVCGWHMLLPGSSHPFHPQPVKASYHGSRLSEDGHRLLYFAFAEAQRSPPPIPPLAPTVGGKQLVFPVQAKLRHHITWICLRPQGKYIPPLEVLQGHSRPLLLVIANGGGW